MTKFETDSQIQRENWWFPEKERFGGLGERGKGTKKHKWVAMNSHMEVMHRKYRQ